MTWRPAGTGLSESGLPAASARVLSTRAARIWLAKSPRAARAPSSRRIGIALAMRRANTEAVLAGLLARPSGPPSSATACAKRCSRVLAQVFYDRCEEGFFRGKVAVNGPFGDTGGRGDLANGHGGVALRFREKLEGRVDQALLGFTGVVEAGREGAALCPGGGREGPPLSGRGALPRSSRSSRMSCNARTCCSE